MLLGAEGTPLLVECEGGIATFTLIDPHHRPIISAQVPSADARFAVAKRIPLDTCALQLVPRDACLLVRFMKSRMPMVAYLPLRETRALLRCLSLEAPAQRSPNEPLAEARGSSRGSAGIGSGEPEADAGRP